MGDLWRFDFSSMCWQQVVARGDPPSARHSHSAVTHNHSLYLYGGYDGSYSKSLHLRSSREGIYPYKPVL